MKSQTTYGHLVISNLKLGFIVIVASFIMGFVILTNWNTFARFCSTSSFTAKKFNKYEPVSSTPPATENLSRQASSHTESAPQKETACPNLCADKDTSSIFIVETSKRQSLSLREMCAIESAALHNPDKSVILYSIAPMTLSIDAIQAVFKKYNVTNKVLNLTAIFQDTPLEMWHKRRTIRNSLFPIYHMSDALRLAILWKNGGIYLDSDVITLCPLNCLQNSIGLQFPDEASNGILFFEMSHPFLYSCMQEFAKDYQGSQWSNGGPILVTKTLKKICNVTLLEYVVNKPELCQGIRLLPPQAFLPIPWTDWTKIFTEAYTNFNINGSYMVHLYGYLSRHSRTEVYSEVLVDYLAASNCPETYKVMSIFGFI